MGTNFYISGHRGDDSPEWHVGKRWAAGVYCHYCNTSFSGEVYKECPKCGAGEVQESYNPVKVELGWQKASKVDVDIEMGGTSGFSWAMSQKDLLSKISGRKYPIVDEYGHRYTWRMFGEVLNRCKIRSIDSMGKEFS